MTFEMRPNLKNKKNSQGTLFQGGKPVDEHRYPRGYTPERGAAVDAAVRFVGPPQLNAQARDVIARSTVPLHRVARLTVMPAGLPTLMHQRAQGGEMRFGEHNRGRDIVRLATPTNAGQDSPTAQDVRGKILVHEYGHWVGHKTGRPAPRTDAQRGNEEAFADVFMNRHYRPDPRTVRAGLEAGNYSYREQGTLSHRPAAFREAYDRARPENSDRANTQIQPTTWGQETLW